jgi:hypothetical protein
MIILKKAPVSGGLFVMRHHFIATMHPAAAPSKVETNGLEEIGQEPDRQPTNRYHKNPAAAPMHAPMIIRRTIECFPFEGYSFQKTCEKLETY